MSREATCFSCHHVLRVSPEVQGRWLTCPRCLASVGNPNVLLPAEPSPASVPPEPAPAEAAPQADSCPWCAYPVDPTWRVCPRCARSLWSARPREVASSTDDDVRRDSRGANVIALTLGGLLVIGAVLFVVVGGPTLVRSNTDTGQVFFVGLLALGAFVAGLVVLAVGARSQAVTAVSGVLGGLAVGAGVVLMVVLVLCMTLAAAVTNILSCKCK